VFSHVVRGRPGGLFQLSGGGALRITLVSASSSTHAICPSMVTGGNAIKYSYKILDNTGRV